jgi:hypothetical protein
LRTAYFTDDPIVTKVTVVAADHVEQLRVRIDALRTRSGLGNFNWSDASLVRGAAVVNAIHVAELRNALDEAYGAAGQTHDPWEDALIARSTVIRAVHIEQLRRHVMMLEQR